MRCWRGKTLRRCRWTLMLTFYVAPSARQNPSFSNNDTIGRIQSLAADILGVQEGIRAELESSVVTALLLGSLMLGKARRKRFGIVAPRFTVISWEDAAQPLRLSAGRGAILQIVGETGQAGATCRVCPSRTRRPDVRREQYMPRAPHVEPDERSETPVRQNSETHLATEADRPRSRERHAAARLIDLVIGRSRDVGHAHAIG